MKQFKPLALKPNTNQFFELVKDKLTQEATRTIAYKATLSLFKTSENIYRTLNELTNEQLSVFVDAGKYITLTQEHDLVVLTTRTVGNIDTSIAKLLIQSDPVLTSEDRTFLLNAIECFSQSSRSTIAALSQPRWFEP